MNSIRKTFFAAAVAAFAAVTASAQAPAARPASPATPQGGAAVVAEGKFAVVDTDLFADQKQGIQRLIAAYQTIDREFKPRRDEVMQLQTRYEALVKEINDTKAVANPQALSTKADQAEALKTEIERKQQDGQKALQKRAQELISPVNQDIQNALQAFARTRGISVVFDLSKLDGVMMVVNPNAIDITGAFVAEYNQRNPATAAASAPPARP